ncbi:MAG TPA: hypothetical protein HA362_07395 [Nanoarchaeota archaeon]|nr:hypothetical protein [Nanoarchaeota archaeon]
MAIKTVLAICFAIIILCSAAAAQEESGCAGQAMPEGYKCIEGSRGVTVYNPGQISAVFDDYEESDGTLALNYALPGSETSTVLGYLSGIIALGEDGKSLKVTSGAYTATETSGLGINITGTEFYASNENLPFLGFRLTNAIYTQYGYDFICQKNERCAIGAIVLPAGEKPYSYLNITGKGAAVDSSKVGNYIAGREIEEKYITNLTDLKNIVVQDSINLTITAYAPDSIFGGVAVKSDEKIMLKHMKVDSDPQARRFIGPYVDNYYSVIAKEAQATPLGGAVVEVFAKNIEENAEGITVVYNNFELLRLSRGSMVLVPSNDIYKWSGEDHIQQEMGRFDEVPPGLKDILDFFLIRGSGFVDPVRGIMKFRPRTYVEEGIEYPFTLKIMLPADGSFRLVSIGKFDTFGIPSSVTLERQGLPNRQLLFYRGDVYMPEGMLGNWFDFGVSFNAYVYEGGKFQLLECNVNTRSCMLERSRVLGEHPKILRKCSASNSCGEGLKCVESVCVIKKECREAYPGENAIGNKLDILFIGEGYANEEDFLENSDENSPGVKLLIDKEGDNGFDGLLSVSPFSKAEQKPKMRFWYVLAEERMALEPRANPDMVVRYINSLMKRCADADKAVFVSKMEFRSFSEPEGVVITSGPTYAGLGKGLLLVHEFAHGFAKVWDEYWHQGPHTKYFGAPNCLPTREDALQAWTNILGDRAEAERILAEEAGENCGGDCTACTGFIRPSELSLMSNQIDSKTFNSISEKWIEDKLAAYS